MRKLVAFLAAAGLSATSALAATVTFAPNPGGSDTVNMSALPQTVNFDVTIGLGTTATMLSIDAVYGSSGPLTMNGFVYNPDLNGRTVGLPIPPAPIGIPGYTSDLYTNASLNTNPLAGGNPANARPLPYLFGTLAVGVPGGLTAGDYTFGINSVFDEFSGLNGVDSLIGAGTVHVVPEPATLGLLALGALGLIRRRLA